MEKYCLVRLQAERSQCWDLSGKYGCRRKQVGGHRSMELPGDRNRFCAGVLHVLHLPEARVRDGQARFVVRRVPCENQDPRTVRSPV